MAISKATTSDVPLLVSLINSAYRGDASRKGWTHEADLFVGNLRTDNSTLTQIISNPGSVILKFTEDGCISGCVFLEKKDRGLYLGLLSVAPELQANGIGKKLLKAAKLHAVEEDCRLIFLTVISVRRELISWYERHGYYLTGETSPFPKDDRFGVPTRSLEFATMEKVV